jgi:hypothetical protein
MDIPGRTEVSQLVGVGHQRFRGHAKAGKISSKTWKTCDEKASIT